MREPNDRELRNCIIWQIERSETAIDKKDKERYLKNAEALEAKLRRFLNARTPQVASPTKSSHRRHGAHNAPKTMAD